MIEIEINAISDAQIVNKPFSYYRPNKRSQVSRACDWCRVHRVKCDSEQPCQNCRNRGAQCSTTGANEIRNLPHAFREIERLRNRVKELEGELQRRDRLASDAPSASSTTSGSPQAPTPAPKTDLTPTLICLIGEELWVEDDCRRKASNVGLYIGKPQKQWFGPSSLFFFIGRMTSHLARFLEHPPADHTIHWSSTAQSFCEPTVSEQNISTDEVVDTDLQATNGPYLTALQEEYFLGFFWQSYHCSYQIIDETKLRELYRSLWTSSSNMKTRKSSALVDIILALCIQYDTALPLRRNPSGRYPPPAADTKDSTIAGRWYYQRCQSLLMSELECPTLSTLQCHIFCVVYLCCAGFQNMAHGTLALAVRTAHILGLHLEPPEDLPRPERELRKRLWWTLYTLESKTCLKLGRPWSAPMADTTCCLPADDYQLAIQSGSAVLAGGNVTWLTYTLQITKLVLAVRNSYLAFYHECARALNSAPSNPSTIYDSPELLESVATFLQTHMTFLETFVSTVPDALRTKRKPRGGDAFSTSGTSELAIETFAPLWLQRQRLFLELLYHNLSVILYRPLISFTPLKQTKTPTADVCATRCVSHAITMTRMTHQALSETDLLKGWHEGFQWQWNAAITMVGFNLAYPLAPTAAEARAAIDMAIEVFDIFGRHFAVGARAARVVRELTAKTDFLLGIAGGPPGGPVEGILDATGGSDASPPGSAVVPVAEGTGTWGSEGMAVDGEVDAAGMGLGDGRHLQDVLSGTMDVAFSVDSYNNFEIMSGNGFGFGDIWSFQGGDQASPWRVGGGQDPDSG
ncbi:fungal-specific transcription factor domain-containing protein [Lasiosphaeria hispida]|uniref:Fungal-specific transcription factor domain-containing protein n=1 Tax=Lasiosphaeria hispida TaxID=260671 RepID=A0AAJ0MBS5_9PEZI|nr:fungal-specific transcription factor domain-containing protein [Lasiosphaeria hispida]